MPSTLFLIFFFIFFPDPSPDPYNTSIPAKSSFPARKTELATEGTDAVLSEVEGEIVIYFNRGLRGLRGLRR